MAPVMSFKPDESLISSDTVVSPGQEMRFGIIAEGSDNNVVHFFINVIADSSQVYFDTGVNTPYFIWEGSFIKSFNPIETWEFTVRDRYGKSAVVSIEIEADTSLVIGGIDSFLDVHLGAQDNGQKGGCFSLADGSIFLLEDASLVPEKIDLLYYYYGEDENVIASPGANIEDGVYPDELAPAGWEIRNTTRFIKTGIAPEEFDLIQNDSLLIASYQEGEGKRKAKNLLVNDIYSFKTQDQRFGLFKVREVVGEQSGQITFDIKIQQK
jgi:hypothetical protein